MHYYQEKPKEVVARSEYYKKRRRCIRGLKAEEVANLKLNDKKPLLDFLNNRNIRDTSIEYDKIRFTSSSTTQHLTSYSSSHEMPNEKSHINRHSTNYFSFAEENVKEICTKILEGNSLLRFYPLNLLMKILPLCNVVEFRDGEVILKEDQDKLNACYVILSGSVSKSRSTLMWSESTDQETLRAFDTFGEIALYDHLAHAEETCTALGNVRCIKIQADHFEFVLRSERMMKNEENRQDILAS